MPVARRASVVPKTLRFTKAHHRAEQTYMHRLAAGLLVLLFHLPVTTEADGQEQPLTPAAKYKTLRLEYDRASSSGVALTDAERLRFVGRVYQHRTALARQFLALAEQYPGDPVALDALVHAVWQVNSTPWPADLVGEDSTRTRAFDLLQRDHLRSDKLGPLCERIAQGFCPEYEKFLRTVLASNPHRPVQATACLSLARFLHHRREQLDLCREQPALAREFAGLFGKEYLARLQQEQGEKALDEVRTLFNQAAEKYGDVKLPGGDTVAARANAELFAVVHLRVGALAPDIEGQDQDGRRFKLSDYRGKVVLLDFWSYV